MTAHSPQIDLIYERGCPNIARARTMIRTALLDVGAASVWNEWDRDDALTPEPLRRYGSPTVLVNGRDVGSQDNESAQSQANSCRIYFDECGCACGAPPSEVIAQAIRGPRVG